MFFKNTNIINHDKLCACIYILNHRMENYYKCFEYTDFATFSECTICCFKEETDVLTKCIQKLLDDYSTYDFSDNVVYWAVCCYYYNTTVLDHHAVHLANHCTIKKYYDKYILSSLTRRMQLEKRLQEKEIKIKKLRLIQETIFSEDETEDITAFILKIAFSDEECFGFVRRTIQMIGSEISL